MDADDEKNEYWMQKALQLAQQGMSQGEVPVGAVVVHEGQDIGSGFNQPIMNNDPCGHAEIIALRQAALNIGNYRLVDATLYVTLEPCAMCTGAMLHARIKKVVFGASDPKTGAIGGVINLLTYPWNHNIEYIGGVLAESCGELLQRFFQARRGNIGY